MTIFLNGKQKRVRGEPMIDGLPVEEFIRRNSNSLWLHEHEMWEDIEPERSYGEDSSWDDGELS